MTPRGHAPKIYEADATDGQRQMYRDVCDALDSEPVSPEPVETRVLISCRCEQLDRIGANGLARSLGVTRNTLVLTALRIGMLAMGEALASIHNGE